MKTSTNNINLRRMMHCISQRATAMLILALLLLTIPCNVSAAEGTGYGLMIVTTLADGNLDILPYQSCGYQLEAAGSSGTKNYIQALYDGKANAYTVTSTTEDPAAATTFQAGMDPSSPSKLLITSLPAGDYILRQTSVPQDYEGMKGPLYITLEEGTYGFLEDQKKNYTETSIGSNTLTVEITIQNPTYNPREKLVAESEQLQTFEGILWCLLAIEILAVAGFLCFRIVRSE